MTESLFMNWKDSNWVDHRKDLITYIPATILYNEDIITPTEFTLYQN